MSQKKLSPVTHVTDTAANTHQQKHHALPRALRDLETNRALWNAFTIHQAQHQGPTLAQMPHQSGSFYSKAEWEAEYLLACARAHYGARQWAVAKAREVIATAAATDDLEPITEEAARVELTIREIADIVGVTEGVARGARDRSSVQGTRRGKALYYTIDQMLQIIHERNLPAGPPNWSILDNGRAARAAREWELLHNEA